MRTRQSGREPGTLNLETRFTWDFQKVEPTSYQQAIKMLLDTPLPSR
jgi:hypothetical protein